MFAALNGTLFGAGVDAAASTGVVSVPMPVAGRAALRLLLRPRFPLGTLYVGLDTTNKTFLGTVLATSAPFTVAVELRSIPAVARAGGPLVGVEYDLRRGTDPAWPGGCPGCDVAEGTPLVGRYAATNALAARAHALWMARTGFDFITLDWTGICWGNQARVGEVMYPHFADRTPDVQQLLNNSVALLRLHDQMRDEGIATPRIVPILGFDNGPIANVTCLREALVWLATVKAQFPRSFLHLAAAEAPVALIFDGAGTKSPSDFASAGFSINMMGSQLQVNPKLAARGFWSWMDGPPGPNLGGSEVTVTPAFFGNCPAHGSGMWTGADAVGRRGGYTLYQQMEAAMSSKPRVLLLSQWNEFAGQTNGHAYGPDAECYGDSYSRELSNDIEPTSLDSSDCYARPNATCLGWGMYYANLFSALLRGGLAANESFVFITSPTWGGNVSRHLNVSWAVTGNNLPSGLRFSLDSVPVAHVDKPTTFAGSTLIDLSAYNVNATTHQMLRLEGEGIATRFALSMLEMDEGFATPRPSQASCRVQLKIDEKLTASPQVHWQVDAGRAKEGVPQWAAKAVSLGAITGLTGCCGRFSILANGTWIDDWSETKYPLSDWDFVHRLRLTMHFVFTVDQGALMNRTALLAIPAALKQSVAHNFTGYSLDYETKPAGAPGSPAFKLESDGLLDFISHFASALKAVGKELIVDMGGTTASSLSTQVPYQQALVERWAATGVTTLMSMATYYGTDLSFNEVALMSSTQYGVPAHMLSSGIGSSTTAGCGCGVAAHGNRSCCAPDACCGPAAAPWAKNPPFSQTPACVGAPCGRCSTLGTSLPCFNWTAASLRSYATTLARRNITKISVFMSTLDQVEDPATEGRNATSPFFYAVLRDFVNGALSEAADLQAANPKVATKTEDPYAHNRRVLADNLIRRFDASHGLLAGAHAGGNGFQRRGFSIVDENYFGSVALEPFNSTIAQTLGRSVVGWLQKLPPSRSGHLDRRQNLFGKRTEPIFGSVTETLAGSNKPSSPYVVYTEDVNLNVTFTPSQLGTGVNHMVPLLLARWMGGDLRNATAIFRHVIGLWNGTGFLDDAAIQKGAFSTRDLTYMLWAQRATAGVAGFEVAAALVSAVEKQMWTLQKCEAGTALAVTYSASGDAECGSKDGWGDGQQLVSIEANAMALGLYDKRMKTEWFPASRTELKTDEDATVAHTVQMAPPRLAFSDVVSGPASGLGDGLGSGAIVTVWGTNLGSNSNGSAVHFLSEGKRLQPSHVYYWKPADGMLPGGPANLYESHGLQEIALSIPHNAATGNGSIEVMTADGQTSNQLHFTVRSGRILWVAPNGNASNMKLLPTPCTFAAPCAFINGNINSGERPFGVGNARLLAGDTVYSRGVAEPRFGGGGRDCGLFLRSVKGTLQQQVALVAYPGTLPIVRANNSGIEPYVSTAIVVSKFKVEVGELEDVPIPIANMVRPAT